MDSGWSFHIFPVKSWFNELKEDRYRHALLGDNFEYEVKGIDMVRLKLNDGFDKLLSNVRYVPQIKNNLILVGMLDGLGYTIKIEEGKMKVYLKVSLILLKVSRRNGLYIPKVTIVTICLLLLKNMMIRSSYGSNA